MKRIFLSSRSYFLAVIIIMLLAAAIYFMLSKHSTKIPERALFVSLLN